MDPHTSEHVDACLDRVLKAAGSSLRHYDPPSKDRLRKAMAEILLAEREAAHA